jgi:hypothetical protein
MSEFSKDSAFHPSNRGHERGHHESDQEYAERLRGVALPKPEFPVRHVGQANIIEIPIKALEEWTAEIEFIVSDMPDTSDQAALGSILDDLRSYFRG